jgi:hypothetical protein
MDDHRLSRRVMHRSKQASGAQVKAAVILSVTKLAVTAELIVDNKPVTRVRQDEEQQTYLISLLLGIRS